MQPANTESMADTLFQCLVALLSPLLILPFLYDFAGSGDVRDCRFITE